MTSKELLAAATAGHRRTVARELGLPAGSDARRLARAIADPVSISREVEGASPEARGLLLRLAFDGPLIEGPAYAWMSHEGAGYEEIERRGLGHAFQAQWRTVYVLGDDLVAPLRRALAEHAAAGLRRRRAARWVSLPVQTAHDGAAVWAALARAPARLKADGEPYKRVWAQLGKALPSLNDSTAVDDLSDLRVEMALRILRSQGLLRVRRDDRPGASERIELLPTGEPQAVLSRTADELGALALSEADDVLNGPGLALVQGSPVTEIDLASLGSALAPMLKRMGISLPGGFVGRALGVAAIWPAWFAGAVALGVDDRGEPVSVRAGGSAAPAETGRLGVCQADFGIVLLRAPTPSERLSLLLLADPEPGQAHVMRITRDSITAPRRAGVLEDPLARLSGLVGEVPQNVAASLADWWAAHSGAARLRSAIFLDVGEPAIADRLMAGPLGKLAVERLGPGAIAIPAAGVEAAAKALRAAGLELEPGLHRVSGTWSEPKPPDPRAERRWLPARRASSRPPGHQVSTLDEPTRPRRPTPVSADALWEVDPWD